MRNRRTKTARIGRRGLWLTIFILLLLPPHMVSAQENGAAPKAEGDDPAATETTTAGEETPGKADERSGDLLTEDGALDLDAAVEYFEDLYRSESSISEAELKVVRPDSERTLEMKIWTKGDEKALVVIQGPPREKGTATLKVEDNLWNYLPRINRTIRIPPSAMLAPWMGSDFTNDDLVRESSYSEDYTYKIIGMTKDPEGWLIRFHVKEGVVGLWKRFDLWVSTDGRIPLKSEWYDRKGELARVLLWDDVQEMDGKRIPTRMTLIPKDKDEEGHKTIMTYHEIDFGVEIPDRMFSLTHLERTR